jgi:hypothetical protein
MVSNVPFQRKSPLRAAQHHHAVDTHHVLGAFEPEVPVGEPELVVPGRARVVVEARELDAQRGLDLAAEVVAPVAVPVEPGHGHRVLDPVLEDLVGVGLALQFGAYHDVAMGFGPGAADQPAAAPVEVEALPARARARERLLVAGHAVRIGAGDPEVGP